MDYIHRPMVAVFVGIAVLFAVFGVEASQNYGAGAPNALLAAISGKLAVTLACIIAIGFSGTYWHRFPAGVVVSAGCGLFTVAASLTWWAAPELAWASLAYFAVEFIALASLLRLVFTFTGRLAQVDEAVSSIVLGDEQDEVGVLERVKVQLAQSRRFERPMSVMLVEANGDTSAIARNRYIAVLAERLSHRFAASELAKLVKSELRQTDTMLWRRDTNEIAIFCPDTNGLEIDMFAERLRSEARHRLGADVTLGSATFPDVGLTYEDLLSEASTKRQKDLQEQRDWPRYATPQDLQVMLKTEHDEFSCQVLDFSLGGARLRATRPFAANGTAQTLRLHFGDETDVQCKWSSGGDIGIQFDLSEQALNFVSYCLASPQLEPRRSAGELEYDNVVAIESDRHSG